MERKLVLYSDQVIPENAMVDVQLLRLFTTAHPTLAYIPSSNDPQRMWFQLKQAYYRKYNLALSLYFGLDEEYDHEELPRLLACDAIHLSGGNTYQFLTRLRRSDMIRHLQAYAASGGVLIGTSAGAILTTPTIHTAALCGDTPDPSISDLTGLGLVPFAFLPHSNLISHQETAVQSYIHQHKQPLITCPDGAGVIVQGTTTTLIGNAKMYEPA